MPTVLTDPRRTPDGTLHRSARVGGGHERSHRGRAPINAAFLRHVGVDIRADPLDADSTAVPRTGGSSPFHGRGRCLEVRGGERTQRERGQNRTPALEPKSHPPTNRSVFAHLHNFCVLAAPILGTFFCIS